MNVPAPTQPPSVPGAERRRRRRRLGPVATVALGLLAVPRVVLHDLEVDVGPLNLVLVFGPPAAWIWWARRREVARPLLDLALVGVVYGIVLAATHMLLWDEAFEDDPPRLGGNLAGELSPGTEELVLRGSSVLSSVVVGTVFGAISGLIAHSLATRRR